MHTEGRKVTKGSSKSVGILFYVNKKTWEEFCSIPNKRGQTNFDRLRHAIRSSIVDAEIRGEIE